MRVLVTRPASQAAEWAAALRKTGIDAVALPLICIAPAADPRPVQDAWLALPTLRLVVFVSSNAAEHFMAARPRSVSWPQGVLAGSTGPGTSGALQRLGVPTGQIVEPAPAAGQFDSEALWSRLQAREWRGAEVMIVRGDGGREWLADTLRGSGAQVRLLAAYRRSAPDLDVAARALLEAALGDPREHLWLFSSSEAIDNLQALAGPAARWSDASAVATHQRIAARAQHLGLGRVMLAQPTLAAVGACIQSMS